MDEGPKNFPEKIVTLIATLDELIKNGPWESSLFLKGLEVQLVDLRNKFCEEVHFNDSEKTEINAAKALPVHYIELYIVLYQTQGKNLHKWAQVVSALTQHNISRPIYRQLKDVESNLLFADTNLNQAYVVVQVNPEDILVQSAENRRTDKYGCELVILKEGAITQKNIMKFVHKTGEYKLIGSYFLKIEK